MDDRMKQPWMFEQPLCAEIGPAPYFPLADDQADRESALYQDYSMAKKLCKACVHRQECLDWAIVNKEAHGIWGGMSVVERRTYEKTLGRRKAC